MVNDYYQSLKLIMCCRVVCVSVDPRKVGFLEVPATLDVACRTFVVRLFTDPGYLH